MQQRNMSNLNLPKVRTTYYGTDTVRIMSQRGWAKVPTEIKTSSSLTVSKRHLKSKKCGHCNCMICKTFACGLGYSKFSYIFCHLLNLVNRWPELAIVKANFELKSLSLNYHYYMIYLTIPCRICC